MFLGKMGFRYHLVYITGFLLVSLTPSSKNLKIRFRIHIIQLELKKVYGWMGFDTFG